MKDTLSVMMLRGVVMRRAADDAGSPLEDVHQVESLESHRAQLVSLCVVAVSVLLFLHYTAALHQLGLHDVLRRLFYLPVIVAAIVAGRRGGLAVAGFAALGFVPHLRQLARAGDRAMDPVFDLVLLLLVGTLVGAYVDASHRARRKAAERGRLAALGETGLALMAQTEGPLAAIAGQTESLAGMAIHSRSDATAFATRIIGERAVNSHSIPRSRLAHFLHRPGQPDREKVRMVLPNSIAGRSRTIVESKSTPLSL